MIHHDLWDYDLPVPPVLFDVVRDGKKIPAVGAMSKMAMLFILDRVTGKPIYGVEERAGPEGRCARRVLLADAAFSGETAATLAAELHDGRHREDHSRTREGLPRIARKA